MKIRLVAIFVGLVLAVYCMSITNYSEIIESIRAEIADE